MLQNIINTLNNIEVHGKNNLDMLLGCIMALEQINETLRNPPQQEEQTDKTGETASNKE